MIGERGGDSVRGRTEPERATTIGGRPPPPPPAPVGALRPRTGVGHRRAARLVPGRWSLLAASAVLGFRPVSGGLLAGLACGGGVRARCGCSAPPGRLAAAASSGAPPATPTPAGFPVTRCLSSPLRPGPPGSARFGFASPPPAGGPSPSASLRSDIGPPASGSPVPPLRSGHRSGLPPSAPARAAPLDRWSSRLGGAGAGVIVVADSLRFPAASSGGDHPSPPSSAGRGWAWRAERGVAGAAKPGPGWEFRPPAPTLGQPTPQGGRVRVNSAPWHPNMDSTTTSGPHRPLCGGSAVAGSWPCSPCSRCSQRHLWPSLPARAGSGKCRGAARRVVPRPPRLHRTPDPAKHRRSLRPGLV